MYFGLKTYTQPVGRYANTPLTETAPAMESDLPSNVSPVLILMAALLAMTVPFIEVPEAMMSAP